MSDSTFIFLRIGDNALYKADLARAEKKAGHPFEYRAFYVRNKAMHAFEFEDAAQAKAFEAGLEAYVVDRLVMG